MISFKLFVQAIHEAVLQANDILMGKNEDTLRKYFETTNQGTEENKENEAIAKLKPKTVTLEYPHLDSDGNLKLTDISVPLITLTPLNMSQIEKVTFTSEFEMSIDNDELQLEFSNRKHSGPFWKRRDTKTGKIEIVISPQESSEGVKILVEAYDNALKRQL